VVGLRLATQSKKAQDGNTAHSPDRRASGLLLAAGPEILGRVEGRLRISSAGLVEVPARRRFRRGRVWLSPSRRSAGLYSKTLVNGYFDNLVRDPFLEAMMHDLEGRFSW